MAQTSVLFGSARGGKIGELQLDATIREGHSFVNSVSEFPIESGSEVNDHIRLEPEEITMEGLVTNTPINIFQENNAEVITNVSGGVEIKNEKKSDEVNNAQLAFEKLLEISGRKTSGENITPKIVTVVTGLKVYTDMAMLRFESVRTRNTGAALGFTASLRKILFVDSETVEIPNAAADDEDRAQSTAEKGQQNTKDPKAQQVGRSTSVLRRIFDTGKSSLQKFAQ